jgi:O-antigen/teichoic acid export membrane protein
MSPAGTAPGAPMAPGSEMPREGVRRSRRIARNVALRSIAEVVAKLASLGFYVVIARKLGSESYGEYAFALALGGSLLLAAGFGTDVLIARETARRPADAARQLADAAGLKGLMSVPLLIAAAVVIVVGSYPASSRVAMVIVCLGMALEVLGKSWQAVFQGYERLDLAAASLIVQRLFTAAIGCALIFAGGGLIAAAAVYAVGALVGVAVAEYNMRQKLHVPRLRPDVAGGWRLLRAAITIGVAGVLFTLLLRVDVLMLSFLSGSKEVGFYSAAYRLVEGCQFLSWVFGAAMLPWMSGAGTDSAGLRRALTLGLKFEAVLLLPISVVCIAFAEPMIHLLYGNGFAASVVPLRLLGLTVVTYGLQAFAGVALVGRDAPGTMTGIVAFVAVQNLVCNAIFLPRYGAQGAAAVALSSSALLATLASWKASQKVGGLDVLRLGLTPVAAAVAMGAVAAAPLPWPVGIALAVGAYVAVLVVAERVLYPDDLHAFTNLLPTALRRLLPAPLRRAAPGGPTQPVEPRLDSRDPDHHASLAVDDGVHEPPQDR